MTDDPEWKAGVKVPALNFAIINMETTENSYEVKVRVKINGRYFTGILEMSE